MARLQLLQNGEHVCFLVSKLPDSTSYNEVMANCRLRVPSAEFDSWVRVDETSEAAKKATILREARTENEAYLASDGAAAAAEFYKSERAELAERKAKFMAQWSPTV